jgi:hypothetical protein
MAFIFRPGGTADPANGIYVTWAGLMTALGAAPAGPKTLQFDDSITTPIVIPAGTYSMQGVTWARFATANNPCVVSLGEGRIFTQLRAINGALRVTFTGATPPVSDLAAGDAVSIDGGAIIRCSGTGPFFRNTTAGGKPVLFVLGVASWTAAGNPIFDSPVVGAFTMIVAAAYDAGIDPNMLMGVDGSVIALISQMYGIGISSVGLGNVSEIHPNFNGVLLPVNSPRWRVAVQPVITASQAIAVPNQMLRVDPTAGAVTITLPSVKGNRGLPMLVKNVSASTNPITIAPSAGETVEGSAAGLVIAAARGSAMLVADGTSDWSLI